MKIFEAEKRDGLGSLIDNNVIAYKSVARSTDKFEVSDKILQAQASNPGQMDLYYIDSILASIGWNQNDDIFAAQDMWDARTTPIDKQFNFMHDESDIIGHITASRIIDKNNQPWTSEEVPDKFHIVVSSVLYTHWTDPDLQERMDKIIADIKQNEWYVSMECLFSKFDYGVITPEGDQKVIARAEETAFLTKYLRAYGGSGEYDGHKIGRVLRGFTFSGKGLVNNPANPDSIIFGETQHFCGVKASIQETNMSDVLKEQIDDLKAQLKESKASVLAGEAEKTDLFSRISDLEQKDNDKEVSRVEAEKADLQKTIDELTTAGQAKDATIEQLKEEKTASEETVASLQKEVDDNKLASVKAARMLQLTSSGVEEAKAEELVEKFAEVDENVFSELLAAFVPFKKKEDKDKKDDKKDDKKEDKSDDSKAETKIDDEEIEQVEAGVKSQETKEEDLEKTRASVSNFLCSNLK